MFYNIGMTIPKNWFMFINIIVAVVFLIYIFKSYKNGFVYELVNLVFLVLSVIASWIIAPILASKISIFDVNQVSDAPIPSKDVNIIINSLIWFIIILVLLNVLFLLIKPLLKFVSKIPLLGTVNKVLGGIVGILYGLFVTIIISMIFTMPIFKNGKEVVDNTILKYANSLNKTMTKYVVENIDLSKVSKYSDDFNVDTARKELETWLISQGVIDD